MSLLPCRIIRLDPRPDPIGSLSARSSHFRQLQLRPARPDLP